MWVRFASVGTRQGCKFIIPPWCHLRIVPSPGWDEPTPPILLLLHHVEGFQDDNFCAALQHWTPLGLVDGLLQRVSLDDRVATGHAQRRAITDGAIARDGFGLAGGGIA